MFAPGDTVRLVSGQAGMPAGSEGLVRGWYTNSYEVVVAFWDGGPLRVPAESLQLVQKAPERRRGAYCPFE